MCLLAVLYKIVPRYPIVLAANRDEYYDRQGEPPRVWEGAATFVAPKDARAGGTWIGCNSYETVVAVTNRRASRFDRKLRSRGLLCADLLETAFPAEAARVLMNHVARCPCNGFNLFCAGSGQGFVVHYEGSVLFRDLRPGIHVLSNGDLNDEASWKVSRTRSLLERLDLKDVRSLITDLKIVCADHEPDPRADASREPAAGDDDGPICLHGRGFGTLSSTIMALGEEPAKSIYLHAQGSPCTTPYEDYSEMLRSILVRAKWAGR